MPLQLSVAKPEPRHLGGGPKGLFLLLRYVFIAAACYLLVFHAERRILPATLGLAAALALASNVALSRIPPRVLFAWWVTAPILIVDTVWVAWALGVEGGIGEEFFLLYLFVMLLAAVGDNLLLVVAGATVASVASAWASWRDPLLTSPALLRIVFLFVASIFYGHVLGRFKAERLRSRTLEGLVAERTAELQRLYEASRAASREKTDYLASMSHEVRTPLHIVVGYADMLLDGAASSPVEAAAIGGHIRRAATGLLHLVDGLLEMGRLESGTVRVEPRAVGVAAFAKALQLQEWIPPQPGVVLRWDWDHDAGAAQLQTDPDKLRIVLGNLITNALKYTRRGHIVIGVRDEPAARAVAFLVADTGPGIPPARLARMREPFHESTGASHGPTGIGLGMAIVYRYASLLGTDVRVDSEVGRGTSFTVTVPYGFTPCPA